jgi:NTE family protein
LFRFSKPYIWDYQVGKVEKPTVKLAKAVAASSAFPPFLSPCELDLSDANWVPGSGNQLERPEFQKKIKLSDGGVYDNLGLETTWKCSSTLLVSDGGGSTPPEADPNSDWARQTKRVLDIIDSQVRALRKRMLIAAYSKKEMAGSYWSIRTNIDKYTAEKKLPAPYDRTQDLAATPTRLAKVAEDRQERLINWGYAICDAGMRSWVDPSLPPPSDFPYPGGV